MVDSKLTPETYRWLVRWFLIADGLVLMCASAAIFLPPDWMQQAHAWLGLNEMPESPIVFYLARSTSMLYAVHGVIVLTVGWKLDQFAGLVPVLAFLHFLMGCVLLGIDWTSGLPTYWLLGEGPPIAMSGVLLWFLARQAGLLAKSGD